MTPQLEDYIERHTDPEPRHLQDLQRDIHLHLVNPQMSSGHLQGRLLKMLATMIRPRRVLELGTYGSYAAQCLAEGMEPGTELHTIEIFDELEDFIAAHLAVSPVADRIHLHIGDAAELLPSLGSEPFDLVFIDANKRAYADYYRLVFDHVRPGGYIIADNTLWYGNIVDPAFDRDPQTRGIRDFNDLVGADTRVEKVIIPLRDGLTIIRRLPQPKNLNMTQTL